MIPDDAQDRLREIRENRMGKGLYIEPSDKQILQIWEIVTIDTKEWVYACRIGTKT